MRSVVNRLYRLHRITSLLLEILTFLLGNSKKYKIMRFLNTDNNTKELEKGMKNKWRWEWLNEKDETGEVYGSWLKKPDIAGVAFCVPCGKTINYKTNGKRIFKQHASDKSHQKNVEVIKTNQVLPGSSKALSSKAESMQDRIAKQRALTSAFISEHCLPFSLAEDLVNLAKRLSEDKRALEKTTISRTSATYINTHGVAKAYKEEMKINSAMKRSCIHAYDSYQKHLKKKKEIEIEKKQQKLDTSVQLLKKEKAKRLATLIKLKNRISNKGKRKTTSDEKSACGGRQWKRIKIN